MFSFVIIYMTCTTLSCETQVWARLDDRKFTTLSECRQELTKANDRALGYLTGGCMAMKEK